MNCPVCVPFSAMIIKKNKNSNQSGKKRLSISAKIAFSLIIAAGLIGFLELFASFWYFLRVPKKTRETLEIAIGLRGTDQHLIIRYRSHPYLNFILNPDYQTEDGYHPYNSMGFREPEWPIVKGNAIHVVAIGASTTFGMFARSGKEVWPFFSEKELQRHFSFPVRVFNLGIPYYTTYEMIGVMAMLVPELQPDIVLIHAGANDAFSYLYPHQGGPDNRFFRYSWSYQPPSASVKFFLRKSYFLRVLALRLSSRLQFIPADTNSVMQYPLPGKNEMLINSRNADGRYFNRNIRTLIAICRSQGALPVILSHPLNPRWEKKSEPIYRLLVEGHLRNNRILAQIAALEKLPFIDLYAAARDERFFIDAIHESAAGMKQKAEIISDALLFLLEERKTKEGWSRYQRAVARIE